MAEKKTSITFELVMRDLKARTFSPIYILMGEESFYIDKISDYIADNVLQPEERDFNQTIVFGSDMNAAQIVDLAKAYPMMAEKRVVIVKESQDLHGNTEFLEKYLDKPVSSTVLVFCHKNGTIDRRKKIVGKAETVGVVFESKKKRDYELPGFVENYLKQHKATIDNKAAVMMADHVGSDLSRLISELDKVLISLPQDRRVTPDIVERQIGISKEFNAFELRNAIINRNIFKANQIIKYFDKNPKAGSIYSFLPLLFNYFQNLMIAYYAPNRNNENSVAQYLELRGGWAAKDYVTGMRNYTGMKTMQIISEIREIDARSKGLDNPNTGVRDLMKELIFFILH